jgi:hypothetical protein
MLTRIVTGLTPVCCHPLGRELNNGLERQQAALGLTYPTAADGHVPLQGFSYIRKFAIVERELCGWGSHARDP